MVTVSRKCLEALSQAADREGAHEALGGPTDGARGQGEQRAEAPRPRAFIAMTCSSVPTMYRYAYDLYMYISPYTCNICICLYLQYKASSSLPWKAATDAAFAAVPQAEAAEAEAEQTPHLRSVIELFILGPGNPT